MTNEKRGTTPCEIAPPSTCADSTRETSRETRWGAYPEDWQCFVGLGLTADLLPVVSDPTVPISPHSKMSSIGKTPSRINAWGHASGFKDWTQHRTTASDIGRWLKDDRLGICLQTRTVRAIDVDVPDAEEAARIAEKIGLELSQSLPRRQRSNSAKFLLAFQLPGDFSKRSFKTKHGLVEFLATGQQFIAAGTHPSGARYEWPGGLPADIPSLTPEQFEALWAVLVAAFAVGESTEHRQGATPDRARTADDTNDPLVDFLYREWTVYGTDRSGRVDIECPFADGHTTESSESSTSYFPAGVGGIERGMFKCLHTSCAHRTQTDFADAVGWRLAGFEVIACTDAELLPREAPSLTHRENGTVPASRRNLQIALAHPEVCGTTIRYDEFTGGVVVGNDARPLRDSDYTALALHLETQWNFSHVSREMMREMVSHAADSARFDSAKHWLDGLTWDGTPRVDSFLPRYAGAEDSEYTRAVSRYMWSAMAGRVLEPGVKADMVPVLVGRQGAGKSRLCATLVPCGDYFAELDLKKDDDALARAIRGKLVAELPELAGVGKREIEHLKAWITRRVEKWIPKYLECETTYARRCLFIGTSNDAQCLPPDPTGHRRWLPVQVGDCDFVGIERDRLQLWAEGAVLFRNGGILWQGAETLAREVTADFVAEDPWKARVEEWLSADDELTADKPLTSESVLQGALGFLAREMTHANKIRVAGVMRLLGYVQKPVGRARTRCWVRTG